MKHKGHLKQEDLDDFVQNNDQISSKYRFLQGKVNPRLNDSKDVPKIDIIHHNSDINNICWSDHEFKSSRPENKSISIEHPSFDCDVNQIKVKSTKISMKDEISFLLRKLSALHNSYCSEFQEIRE